MPGLVPGINVFRYPEIHHLRWRDIYHFVAAPVYQRFRCERRALNRSLRVSSAPRRLTRSQP